MLYHLLKRSFYRHLSKKWFEPGLTPGTALLWPASMLNHLVMRVQKYRYHRDSKTIPNNRPVIALGHLTAGNYHQASLMISLVRFLQAQGFHPGVLVQKTDSAYTEINQNFEEKQASRSQKEASITNEALWIWQKTKAAVVSGAKYSKACHQLISKHSVDVVLLHDVVYPADLCTAVKMLTVDAGSWLGNQCLLPAGPLRIPLSSLQEMDFIFIEVPYIQGHGDVVGDGDLSMLYRDKVAFLKKFAPQSIIGFIQLVPERFRNLDNGTSVSSSSFSGRPVCIGAKSRASYQDLLKTLRVLGICPQGTTPSLEHQDEQADFERSPDLPTQIVYEKDGMGHKKRLNKRSLWVLESTMHIEREKGNCIILEKLMNKIKQCNA